VLALGLLVVVLLTEGKPSFWVAVTGISAVLVMHATMIPNVTAVALEPLGHVAGMASAVIGTMSFGGGALLGTLIDRNISGTITPLVVGMVVYGSIAAGWIAWAEHGTTLSSTS
jgi:DHA1 family bicyclomycin/chloramphenicol resistance-like MFS transporter